MRRIKIAVAVISIAAVLVGAIWFTLLPRRVAPAVRSQSTPTTPPLAITEHLSPARQEQPTPSSPLPTPASSPLASIQRTLKVSPSQFDPYTFIPATGWKDVGTETPAAALQTCLWAITNGEVERVADIIQITRNEKNIEEWLRGVSETVRNALDTPELIVAAKLTISLANIASFNTALPDSNYQPGNPNGPPGVALFTACLAGKDQSVINKPFWMLKTENGWKIVISKTELERLFGRKPK